MDSGGDGDPVSNRTKWLKFGFAVAILHYAFLGVLFVLLRINVRLALVVATVVSIVGGLALTWFVLRCY